MSNEGDIVCKQQLTYELFHGFRVNPQASQVEETTVSAETDVYSVIKVFGSKASKQCGCENMALLDHWRSGKASRDHSHVRPGQSDSRAAG